MPGEDRRLSPEALELEARYHDVVTSLTDAPLDAAPKPRRSWPRGGRARAWSYLAFGLFLVFTILALFEVLDDDEPGVGAESADSSAEAAQASSSAAPPGGRWHFTADESGSGLYTIDLFGDGASGPIDILEDGTEVGTYSWDDSTLTIEFTRVLTLPDGFQVTEPSSFVCIWEADMKSLACTYEHEMWLYVPETGLEVTGTSSGPAHGVRQG